MSFILKTRAITGALVPFRGEHREYKMAADAHRDAELLAMVLGPDSITVVEFQTDHVLATY